MKRSRLLVVPPDGPPQVSVMSFAKYSAISAANWSSIRHLSRSPAHYLHAKMEGTRDSVTLKRGRATHVAVLEPERFASTYGVWGGRRAGKECVMTLPSMAAVEAWTAAICSADERVIMAAVALQLAYLEARREVEAEERISASLASELEQARTEARAARQGMLKYAAQAGELSVQVDALGQRIAVLDAALARASFPIPPPTISVTTKENA